MSATKLAGVTATVPNFQPFKTAVRRQFNRMTAHDLFRTEATGDELWDAYLASFPEGTNPVYRKRSHHDCGCCRQFIRAMGNVVAIIGDELSSLWDIYDPETMSIDLLDPAYATVARALSELVKSRPIANRFVHYEAKIGTDKNYEDAGDGVHTWNHFFAELPNRNERKLVYPKKDIGPLLSETRAQHDVLLRSLTDLTADSAVAVLDLIDRNSLYRGEEHRHAVQSFLNTKRVFDLVPGGVSTSPIGQSPERDRFVWQAIGVLSGSVSKIRNTSIGQLLIDLSEGRDLEESVKAYERIVAPTNYKRPTALVTQRMVDSAKETVENLGLTSALERRFATLADVSVNNVLFADRSARKVMKGAFDGIATAPVVKPTAMSGVPEVPIEAFLKDILPGADKLEIMVENRHAGNFVSLIAPADPGSKSLFQWENRFSWSYAGDVADSIKERVKKAGGSVTGEVCCRLAWFNTDDLDLSMISPEGLIFYGSKGPTRSGGTLDVDMNVGAHLVRDPVENIAYPAISRMPAGLYSLRVNQFTKRNSTDVGFDVEIDILGDVRSYRYDAPLRPGETVEVARFSVSGGKIEFLAGLSSTSVARSRKIWNVDTNDFHRVNVVMFSPNHWDDKGVGNRHYFFMLDGCVNDGSARGFYNEFLSPELAVHRKVFEILGAKMRAEESPDQLSGVGFSSTQRNSVVVRVSGARTLKVTF